MWVGLATTVTGSPLANTTLAVNASGWRSDLLTSSVTSTLTVGGAASGMAVSAVTGLADKIFASNATGPSGTFNPVPDAVALSLSLSPGSVSRAAKSWWATFWNKSSVSTPTLPALEYMWYGALFMTAGFASTDPSVPPSGLYGPWVTADNPSWNGDFTLDYNQEAQFYHVHKSNHPELAASYFGSIVDWQPKARALAASFAQKAQPPITCSDGYGILFPCHIAPWGYQSYDQSRYNMFNGMYATMLFINEVEYTGNATFAKQFLYPLLEGFMEFWHCFLVEGPGGMLHDNRTHASGAQDNAFEGRHTGDPVSTLALIQRMGSYQIELADMYSGVPAPKPYVADILKRLAPFSTGTNAAGQAVWTTSPTVNVSKSECSGSGECDPYFPVWPSELVNPVNATPDIQRIANATSFQYHHGNGLAISWPYAIRSSTEDTVDAIVQDFAENAAGRIGLNLIKYATGGGTENAGMAQALNDMFLAAPGGRYIHVFPAWPKSEPASFTTLRAKGGFLVSATWNNVTRQADGVVVTAAVTAATVSYCWTAILVACCPCFVLSYVA